MIELAVDDPFTLQEAARVPLAEGGDVDRVLDRAREAARAFAATPIEARVALCLRAVEAMEADVPRIAAETSRMMGKPLKQAENEVAGMAKRARHLASIAAETLADTVIPSDPKVERRIARAPLGVVLDLPAWNYPLLTAVNVVVPAVLAGNAVVLKHSPRTPLSSRHFTDAFEKAGAPEGLVQPLDCDHATSERIAGDRRVDHVAFTGSVYGGHRIYAAAAREGFVDGPRSGSGASFKDVGLELGGKDGAYVAPDADLERAVAGLVDGACYNAGQSCCAVERVYVHRSLYDRFVEAAVAEMKNYVLGDPRDPKTSLGPIAQPWQPAFIARQIEQARSKGAKVLLGGKPTSVDGRGRFFEPTVLVDCDPSLDVMRKETFGPVLPIVAVDSDDEAVALINDSDLGLTASVWTADRERAARLGARLEVGTVYMNACDALDPALPWTGVKDSGKGSTLSTLGLLALTRPKAMLFRLP